MTVGVLEFPLYGMRRYDLIYEEGDYIIVQTPKTRWVLDYKCKTNPSYWERRLALKGDKRKPYKLYPLKKKYTQLSQLVNCKFKKFINSRGEIVRYAPQKQYPLIYEKIAVRWTTKRGTTAVRTKKCPTTFIIHDYGYSHIGYIKMGRRFILYELCTELKKNRRKKV